MYFAEELNNITLRANDDERMQSIDSIELYAYGTSKNLVCKKEGNKCNNKIPKYKKWLTLAILQEKT